MRLPNGYGSVYKLSGKRRKPFIVKKTLGYHVDYDSGKSVRDDMIIGYAETKAEGYGFAPCPEGPQSDHSSHRVLQHPSVQQR